MFLVSDDGVVAVDAPPSLGENYIKAIREVTDKPIKSVIYSHSDSDHIVAAGNLYPDNVTIIAQDETDKLLKIANDSNLPIPTVTFKDNSNRILANQTLELDYKGVNYEPGNTYIYAPNQKTLTFVDVIFLGWVPFKELV
jgi:flavorubredoxin